MRTVFRFFNMYAFWLLICSSPTCFAGDTLNAGQKIIGNDTNLVSAGKIFELGFFTPNITSGSQSYLGIWYHMQEGLEQPQKQIVVWVANRDNPVAVGSTGVVKIAEDGNLVVEDTSGSKTSYWSSKSEVKVFSNSSPKNRTVKLMDSGNLVLLDDDGHKEVILWESFENPTDTFLLGMKMDGNMKLTSWRSGDDPGSGNFSFTKQNGVNRFIISNRDQLYWESELYDTRNLKLNNDQLDDISSDVYNLLTNFSLPILNNTRLFLNSTGVLQWVDNLLEGDSSVKWKQPKTKCLRYNSCGNFTRCNDNDQVCKCLPGFDNDNSVAKNSSQEDMAGCKRRHLPSCNVNDTALLNLTMIKTRSPDNEVTVDKEEDCKSTCFNTCPPCQAYSYAPPLIHMFNPSTCWIWTHSLTTLKEEYSNWENGRRLFVVVDKSDLATTPRTCEPCGANTVPYPLSTGSNCGDPTYFNFRCNASMGQLSFTGNDNNVNYRVIRVDPDTNLWILGITGNTHF
ncbi:G-type lectin S-receptor-like serine/threonine-protein kinase At4g03230 [Vicia villosa]|uniref:G-type lectin S-receptor-like serine/threonine-protein kinase At4g03230 n=1 Tax=Vicia villosa TaxID=3911 RepID=UPI00273B6138|nr:G-type lectin S-receptor-like serine/threonine-protein kinase At4g03230 [Vicia villosa]